jgi:SM-20-related protein
MNTGSLIRHQRGVALLALSSLLADALADPGYGVFPQVMDSDLLESLCQVAETLREEDTLSAARIGSSLSVERRPEIRSDRILWLTRDAMTPPPQPATQNTKNTTHCWLDLMDEVMHALKPQLFLPLDHYEGHIACYPPGGFYKPHLDQHHDTKARQITLIIYLNRDWKPEHGGRLRLYTSPQQGIRGPHLEVDPVAGTLVCFRSGEFWHEVLPATVDRFSLTGWFRVQTSPVL